MAFVPHHTGTSVLSQMQQETFFFFEQTILKLFVNAGFPHEKEVVSQ